MRRHPARARAARCRARSAVWLTISALAAIPLAGCASGASSAGSVTAGSVTAGSVTAGDISISTGGCGGSWHLDTPGWHTFQLHNAAADSAEVELINPASGAVYDDIENLGAGTTDPMRINIGSGAYAFRCLIEDTDAITGPTEKVPGHTTGAAAILPVTDNDLYTPANEYHTYVTTGLVTLVSQVTTLNRAIQGAIRSRNLAAAKSAWLPAHLTYERLGAAYDSFGDFDGEIEGRADGLVGGVSSADWTGFYRLEYGLWHGQSAATLAKVSAQLGHDVRALQASWPSTEIGLLNEKHVTWGWFQGGFAPTSTNSAGYAVCGATHDNVSGTSVADYSPHHNPFEYYKSTANPKHLAPSSEAMIGQTDQANHEYDLSDFYTTLKDGNMPAVSYLKAAEY